MKVIYPKPMSNSVPTPSDSQTLLISDLHLEVSKLRDENHVLRHVLSVIYKLGQRVDTHPPAFQSMMNAHYRASVMELAQVYDSKLPPTKEVPDGSKQVPQNNG